MAWTDRAVGGRLGRQPRFGDNAQLADRLIAEKTVDPFQDQRLPIIQIDLDRGIGAHLKHRAILADLFVPGPRFGLRFHLNRHAKARQTLADNLRPGGQKRGRDELFAGASFLKRLQKCIDLTADGLGACGHGRLGCDLMAKQLAAHILGGVWAWSLHLRRLILTLPSFIDPC
jgi:hypothetical protein